MDEGREPRIAGYTVARPRTTPVISAVEVEERSIIKEEVQQQARVEASWISTPTLISVKPIDIDAVERGVRERQEETLQKQVVAEAVKRKTAPPRVVERRRAVELAAFKEERRVIQVEEAESLKRQGYAAEDIAELVYGVEQPEHVDVPVEERVYTPLPVADPVTVEPDPLVVGLEPGPDTMFRRLLLLGVIASIAKGLGDNR